MRRLFYSRGEYPFDKEVSLDPELLGKVFRESVGLVQSGDSNHSPQKQTGSFYTPREIVQYMVDESLIAHLKRTAGEELEPKLRQLLQYTDDDVELTEEQRMAIMQSLYHCKILDPLVVRALSQWASFSRWCIYLAALT